MNYHRVFFYRLGNYRNHVLWISAQVACNEIVYAKLLSFEDLTDIGAFICEIIGLYKSLQTYVPLFLIKDKKKGCSTSFNGPHVRNMSYNHSFSIIRDLMSVRVLIASLNKHIKKTAQISDGYSY
jgi:hypothetical protein